MAPRLRSADGGTHDSRPKLLRFQLREVRPDQLPRAELLRQGQKGGPGNNNLSSPRQKAGEAITLHHRVRVCAWEGLGLAEAQEEWPGLGRRGSTEFQEEERVGDEGVPHLRVAEALPRLEEEEELEKPAIKPILTALRATGINIVEQDSPLASDLNGIAGPAAQLRHSPLSFLSQFDFGFHTSFPRDLWQIFFCAATGHSHPGGVIAERIDSKCRCGKRLDPDGHHLQTCT
eukprot:414432-Rhodomonas_salina.1